MRRLVKSYWVSPDAGEAGAPEKRIVHGQYIWFGEEHTGLRLSFPLAQGYFKCGSEQAVDWVEDAQVFAWNDGAWRCVAQVTGLPRPEGEPDWISLDTPVKALFVSVRKSGVDGWWPCYNLAATGVALDGVAPQGDPLRPVRKLHRVTGEPDAQRLKEKGIGFIRTSVTARYETAYYAVGFKLKSIGLNFFGCDGEGAGVVYHNLLDATSIKDGGNDRAYHTQGFVLDSLEGAEPCDFLSYSLCGETVLEDNTLTYHAVHAATGQEVTLRFTMEERRILLHVRRVCGRDVPLNDSAVFRIATNSTKSTMTALGQVERQGETGRLPLPVTVDFPGYSHVVIAGTGAGLRFNSIRAELLNNLDIQVGERPEDNGGYMLKKGAYEADLSFTFGFENPVSLREDTPEIVRWAANKYMLSSLTFRADVDTLTNNGNSMGGPLCLDHWADVCDALGTGENGVDTWGFLRSTLEIHLLGAPAYGAGPHPSGTHAYEDEYLLTGAAVLYGIARYLRCTGDRDWFERYRDRILEKLRQLKARVADEDGLIASTIRRGVYGEHQWSTCWYDVVSYGYKDAFSNGVLYGGLSLITEVFATFGEEAQAAEAGRWAATIKRHYRDTFLTDNGWLAGWRCKENQLHDYGFLAVNGLAVSWGLLEGGEARTAMEKLYHALLASGFDSFDLGLPGNVMEIDGGDLALAQRDLPFGGYQNAGITLSQSRHFINGLYAVGMEKQADAILYEISKGLLFNQVVSGTTSGMDWRAWDGTPSGYEGILCDQFGVFEPLLKRYKRR